MKPILERFHKCCSVALKPRGRGLLPLVVAALAGLLSAATAQELVIPRLPPLKNSVNPNPVLTVQQKTLALFEADKFKELDELAARLRDSQEKDEHGNWKLIDFYGALKLSYSGRVRADGEWNERTKKIERWIAERPESITAHVALANHFINYAWKGRGVHYAYRVTSEGWELFTKRLLDASAALEDGEKLKEKCPEWHRAQLQVALGQSWPEKRYNAAFEKAFAFAPDYWPIVEAKAFSLLPRWHGKEGEWQAYAGEMADRTKAKSGDIYYTIIVRPLLNYYDTPKEAGIDWARFKRGYHDLMRTYPQSEWWPAAMVSSCIWAKDPASAWEAFQKIKGTPNLKYWGTRESFERVRAWATGVPLPPAKGK